jgi:hypothetical protein
LINLFERGEIGLDLSRAACNMGLDGLVSKRRDHTIKPAGRSTGSNRMSLLNASQA